MIRDRPIQARRWFGLLLIAAVMLGCDAIPTSQYRIGATMSSDGSSVEILYTPCRSERVLDVRLEDVGDESGSADNRILWRIASGPGSAEHSSYTVGTTPEGFEEVVNLSSQVADDANLIAVVETDRASATMQFSPADLAPGAITVKADEEATLDVDAYRDQAEASCETPP